MNAALNGLGSDLFGWFGQLSFELGVLALVVLAANRLLPIKSPALRHLLWVVVLLKPIVAVAVSSPFTLFTPFTPLMPLAESGREALAYLPVEPPVHAAAFAIVATSSVQLTAAGWGAILWMAGVGLLIGRILIGHGILWRLRRQAQVHRDGRLFDALRQARQAFDSYPRVEVATSSSIGSPIALGILRPLLVFPADLVDKLRADELSLILMHEMAHVRRCDNLVLLLHRLISAVLFFHPAVWLCGRMLRREAEQACDDLVVCTTGREKAYARGLAQVAEWGARFNPLVRRIPTMNAFAAAESDLALRVRRTLGDGARRMGTRGRVLAAVLLCPLAVVTLPSCGITGKRTGGDMAAEKVLEKERRDDEIWWEAMATDPDEWSEELRLRLLSTIPDSTFQKEAQLRSLFAIPAIVEINPAGTIGAGTIEELNEEVRVWDEARANDPSEWSEELKTQLLVLRPGSTIEEIAKEFSELQALVAVEWPPTDSFELPEELNALINKPRRSGEKKVLIFLDQNGNQTILRPSSVEASVPDTVRFFRPWISPAHQKHREKYREHLQRIAAQQARERDEEQRLLDQLQELKTGERIWAQAVLTDPKDWSEELEAQLLALNPDSTIEEIAEEINKRRLLRKFLEIVEKDPDQWEGAHKLREQVPDSTLTIEEIAKIRRRLQKRARIERVQGGQR